MPVICLTNEENWTGVGVISDDRLFNFELLQGSSAAVELNKRAKINN